MSPRLAIIAALFGAALLGALAVAYGNAQSPAAMSTPINDAQKQTMERVVHDYIIAHPEVVIESLNRYADRQRADAAARSKDAAKKNLSELLASRDGFIAGPDAPKADVAVIEFFDYHCAYCKRAAGFVRSLTQSDPAVEVVFREYPILREESEYPAEVALAARAQGKYADLHFALMSATGILNKDRVKEIAESKGIDFNAVEAALKDPLISKAINATRDIALDMDVEGTPTFVVASTNGSFVDVVPGYDHDKLVAAIADAKKAAKAKG